MKIDAIDFRQKKMGFPVFKEFNPKQKAHKGELRIKTNHRVLPWEEMN